MHEFNFTNKKLKILSLFTGLGGFELGLSLSRLAQHAKVTQMVEINPFCAALLNIRFPKADIVRDVRKYNPGCGEFDIVCGGVPCQNFSVLGGRKGYSGDKNLFPEYFRILRQVKPKYAIIENVPGLLTSNYGQMFRGILHAFYEMGFDVEWNVISAAALGGVHERRRLFVLAKKTKDDATNTKVSGRDTLRGQKTQKRTNKTFEYSGHRTSRTVRKRLNPNFVEPLMGFPIGWTNLNLDVCHDSFQKPELLTHDDLTKAIPHAADTLHILCRRERLQALGNAVVPQCTKVVWNRIYNKEFTIN